MSCCGSFLEVAGTSFTVKHQPRNLPGLISTLADVWIWTC